MAKRRDRKLGFAAWKRYIEGLRPPPLEHLIVAALFVEEEPPPARRDEPIWYVAVLLALDFCAQTARYQWARFDVAFFAGAHVAAHFWGKPREKQRLFDALGLFFGWLRTTGAIDYDTLEKLRANVFAAKNPVERDGIVYYSNIR